MAEPSVSEKCDHAQGTGAECDLGFCRHRRMKLLLRTFLAISSPHHRRGIPRLLKDIHLRRTTSHLSKTSH